MFLNIFQSESLGNNESKVFQFRRQYLIYIIHNILYLFKNFLMNISKWDKKVQIIPNIFLVTYNTAHTTLLCTTDVRNKPTKWLFLVEALVTSLTSIQFILPYIQIIKWVAGNENAEGFFCCFFPSEEMLTLLCKTVSHLQESDGVSPQTQVCYGRTATKIVCYSKRMSVSISKAKSPNHVVTQLWG